MKKTKNMLLCLCLVLAPMMVGTIILSYFSKEVYASGQKEEDLEKLPRRLYTYASLKMYLESNKEKQKILVIGGGLTYDDLVTGKENEVLPKEVKVKKLRKAFFPKNTYLVDLKKEFNYYGEEWEAQSYSDFQADITKDIGKKPGFPKEFIGIFDVVILENLPFSTLTEKAFKNAWDFLKPSGTLICNNYIGSIEFKLIQKKDEFKFINNEEYINFKITDKEAQEITVFYPISGVFDSEKSKFYLFSKNEKIIQTIVNNSQNKEYINTLFENIFKNETFLNYLRNTFLKVIPNVPLQIVKDTEFWYGVPVLQGYFVWKKPK